MAKLQIVPFELAHLQAMAVREFEARELTRLDDVEQRFRTYMTGGMGYTLKLGDQILACTGVYIHWPGMAEVWAITTSLVPLYPLCFHRALKKMLDVVEGTLNLRRIQVAIHADNHVSLKWIQRLGFSLEAPMPGYGLDGATYVSFARLRKPEEKE